MKVQSEAEAFDGHNARNSELVKLIRSKGVDPMNPRTLDIFFWSPSQASGASLALALQELGLTGVEVKRGAKVPETWSVEAHLQASVDYMVSLGFTLQLIQLAAKHYSQYDGWATEL